MAAGTVELSKIRISLARPHCRKSRARKNPPCEAPIANRAILRQRNARQSRSHFFRPWLEIVLLANRVHSAAARYCNPKTPCSTPERAPLYVSRAAEPSCKPRRSHRAPNATRAMRACRCPLEIHPSLAPAPRRRSLRRLAGRQGSHLRRAPAIFSGRGIRSQEHSRHPISDKRNPGRFMRSPAPSTLPTRLRRKGSRRKPARTIPLPMAPMPLGENLRLCLRNKPPEGPVFLLTRTLGVRGPSRAVASVFEPIKCREYPRSRGYRSIRSRFPRNGPAAPS